ncbi:MAG TPA: glycosyltransferase family 2 protein [Pseudomonadales bacterium]|nr:glycosyltransferase family 2 protein [Pseudomonadales bacterium]
MGDASVAPSTVEAKASTDLSSVTIISVTYNSVAIVRALLNSIPSGINVVLVDNGSRDIAQLQALENDHVRVVANGCNRGFGVACNVGARHANSDYLFFVNPDATLSAPTIRALLDAATRYPQAAAFNPAIREGNGRPYFKRSSTLLPRSQYMPRGWPARDSEVSVLSGAAIFVARPIFEKVGGFDENIFLYHEDDDLSLRLRELGPLMFVRDAVVTHIGGAGSSRSPEVAALKAWHMGRSRVYTLRKHGFALPWWRSFGLALWQLLSPLVWFSKRKRAKQVALLKGVWSSRGQG